MEGTPGDTLCFFSGRSHPSAASSGAPAVLDSCRDPPLPLVPGLLPCRPLLALDAKVHSVAWSAHGSTGRTAHRKAAATPDPPEGPPPSPAHSPREHQWHAAAKSNPESTASPAGAGARRSKPGSSRRSAWHAPQQLHKAGRRDQALIARSAQPSTSDMRKYPADSEARGPCLQGYRSTGSTLPCGRSRWLRRLGTLLPGWSDTQPGRRRGPRSPAPCCRPGPTSANGPPLTSSGVSGFLLITTCASPSISRSRSLFIGTQPIKFFESDVLIGWVRICGARQFPSSQIWEL